ncbi:hypothetical protein GpartN1_g4813.t1 [Galdieria partita]|uniref:Major facilitator superfamily (MFS) profile domain-containing protein n=1 Tax=Galdieria partita TaxID=83374 RepID=A0A9C7Q023_9RHOD|nr:hypothetical protein GpartN1_g1846.t1 [Galdieria partita]GJQ13022.1 hypothetical protein GpartN1_g4813.t1 [Galdieria partita]
MSAPVVDVSSEYIQRVSLGANEREGPESLQTYWETNNNSEDKHPSNNSSLEESEKERRELQKAIRFNALGTAMGFFVNGYMYDISSVLLTMYTDLYPSFNTDVFLQTAIGVAMLYGVMFGLLIFGFIADYFGRKKGLIMCSSLVLLGNIIGIAYNGTDIDGALWMMCIGLGVAGLGMGGEYTCNVPNSMEDSEEVDTSKRGGRVTRLVMAMEVLGNYAPFVVQLIIIAAACRNAYLGLRSGCKDQVVTRVSFAVATIPVIIVLVYRTQMKDSRMFTRDQAKRGRKYDGLDLFIFFKHFWARCIGTVIMWFLIDWINYSGGTFGNLVLQKVIGASLFKTVWLTLAEGVAWAVWMPFLVSFIVDRLGRRKTEIFGWLWLASTTLITAGFFWQLRAQPVAYIIWSTFQGGFQYFVFVPVYLVPAEAYPTRIRATMYGVSSSLGKMGGIVGTTIFPQIWKRFGGGSESLDGLRGTMWFNAGLSYVGLVICILFVPEYSQRSLVGEDDRYNELRRRYAGKYIQHLGLNNHEIESQDAESCGIFRLMKYYMFGPKELFLSYQRKYAAMLAQRSGIGCVEEAQEAASLPTYYNDLTLTLKLYWRIRYGKEGCASNERASEDMAYYYQSQQQKQKAAESTPKGSLHQEEHLTASALVEDKQ